MESVDLSKLQHTDACRFHDDGQSCTCGADYYARLQIANARIVELEAALQSPAGQASAEGARSAEAGGEVLKQLFRDAMDWGRSYGQRLNTTEMTYSDVAEGFAEKARAIASTPTSTSAPEVAAPAGELCNHKGHIKIGYSDGSDMAWCINCGVITYCSDGIIPHWAHGRDDYKAWKDANILSFGCHDEAEGNPACGSWCGSEECPVSFRKAASPAPTTEPPAAPAGEPVISVSALSRMFEELSGLDRNQPGYSYKAGWNDALRRAMDYASPAPTPAAASDRKLDLYDEIECDLGYLFGRASLEGHESGQRLAAQVKEKMQKARAAASEPRAPVTDEMVDVAVDRQRIALVAGRTSAYAMRRAIEAALAAAPTATGGAT